MNVPVPEIVFNMSLVALVKEHPVLYSQPANDQQRNEAWTSIMDTLVTQGFARTGKIFLLRISQADKLLELVKVSKPSMK